MPTQVILRKASGFSPAADKDWRISGATITYGEIDLTSLANNAARQSAKIDWGADWYTYWWNIHAAFEMAATPTAGLAVQLWHGSSVDSDATDVNCGNLTGGDLAYSGYSANLDSSLLHLSHVANFIMTVQVTATMQMIEAKSIFRPKQRYGSFVVYNKSGAAFHSAMVKSHIALTRISS